MQATRKRGLDPAPTVPDSSLPPGLKAMYDAWPDRFRTKVRLSAGCWEWQACRDKDGYGRYATTRARGTQPAHRMALELTIAIGLEGPDTDLVIVIAGGQVDHLCRNKSCVRPDHLEVVEPAENIRRGAASNTGSGWCRAGLHPWIDANVTTEANGTRRCRPCRANYERERSQRRRSTR